MRSMFDIIKRQNGEAFAKAILHYDASLFELENLPRIVKFAGRNALPILGTLKKIKEGEIKEKWMKKGKSPYELLTEAGYDAFYADTFEKQNSIQKYFAKGEELCTFRDENRYKKYHIIHAVKKNVDEIKRADFRGKEKRQDEYGTSVISIQVLKEGGFISIKNRYNHTVDRCDNTFDSNPNNIIAGLSDAIKEEFKVDFIDLPGSYIYVNGMILNYWGENEGVYAGDGFVYSGGRVRELNKDKELLVHDIFLLDLQRKKFEVLITSLAYYNWYDEHGCCDPATELEYMLNQEIKEKKLQITRDKKENRTTLFADGEMVISMREGIIDMLCLKKAECLNEFPEEYLTRQLKYYDGVSCYKRSNYSQYGFSASGPIPYTSLPKPPIKKLILSQKPCMPQRQTGLQNDGN